jgi:acetyl-CoA C-acetyltransferase
MALPGRGRAGRRGARLRPEETVRTNAFGGDGPLRLLGETAAEISAGGLDVALLAGGECVASLLAAQRAGSPPPWPRQSDAVSPTRVSGTERPPINAAETAVGLAAPLDVYALIESALAGLAGEDPAAHLGRIAALWSRFSEVAAGNRHAWLPRVHPPEELATVGPANRAVSTPYTKLLSANIQVDQAAALVLCSAGAAEAAGVPRERWVFPAATAQAQEEWFVSERSALTASPAIQAIGRALRGHTGRAADEHSHVDLYSCFPSAVQIAAAELGLELAEPDRPLTLTGGLTFAGGPGNNYATHGVAALVEALRAAPESTGMATAVGWYLTKHAAAVLSGRPPAKPFAALRPAPPAPPPRRAVHDPRAEGQLEAFTVQRERDGTPTGAILALRGEAGDRALARSDSPSLLGELVSDPPLGRRLALGDYAPGAG